MGKTLSSKTFSPKGVESSKTKWVKSFRFFDADFINYLNAGYGDIPLFAMDAINARILAFKANSTWNGIRMLLLAPQSYSMFEPLRDIKTQQIRGNFYNGSTNLATPFIETPCYGSNSGFSFSQANPQLRTQFVPSVEMTLNDSAYCIAFPFKTSAQAGFTIGSFNGATQSLAFQRMDATSNCTADMYNNTVNQGRASQGAGSADGTKGVFIVNRKTNTDLKVFKDGVQIASSTGGGGTLPTIALYLNKL